MTTRELTLLILARVTAPVSLVVGSSISVVLALAGPFGTYDAMSLPMRLAYWGLIVFVSIPFGYASRYIAALWLARPGVLGRVLVPAALMTLAFTPVLYLIVRYLGDADGSTRELLLWLAGLVAVVSVCVNAIRWAIGSTADNDLARISESAVTVSEPPPLPRIVSRLGDLPCTEVLRLSGRDHYVDVVTRRAQKSLLLRLSDAMAEVEGIPGAQVHRSHWVARDAVIAARRDRGRIVLDLVDGSTVPVSRGYRDRAGAAGLLKGLRDTEELAAAE